MGSRGQETVASMVVMGGSRLVDSMTMSVFVYRGFVVVEFVYDKTHVPRICVYVH